MGDIHIPIVKEFCEREIRLMVKDENMKLFIDCDHHGVLYKEKIIEYVSIMGYEIEDLQYGIDYAYPMIATNMCKNINVYKDSRGILICKTGIGMSIVANKCNGIFANNCHTVLECKQFRQMNNGNVLCLGSESLSINRALIICKVFLETDFSEKNRSRLNMILSL